MTDGSTRATTRKSGEVEPAMIEPSSGPPGCVVEDGAVGTVITVPPEPCNLRSLRSILTERLLPLLGTERFSMFLVAISEAVTNAIEVHRLRRVEAPVTVTIDRPAALLTVEDCGGPVPDPQDSPTGNLVGEDTAEPVAPSPEMARGRGIYIMRSICPNLRITQSSTGRTVILPFSPASR